MKWMSTVVLPKKMFIYSKKLHVCLIHKFLYRVKKYTEEKRSPTEMTPLHKVNKI